MIKLVHDSELWQRLRSADHGVIIVVGTGQWGKTATVHSLIDSGAFPGRNVALVKYSQEFIKAHSYPDNYRAVPWPDDISDILGILHPSRDVVVVDDSIFIAGARDSGTRENKGLQKLMTIISHNELFVILTIQNTSMLDISMFQSQDVYMLHKNMDIVAIEQERDQQKISQTIANLYLQRKMKDYKGIVHPKAWGYCSTTREIIAFKLPSWWEPDMSKPFKGMVMH